jgi:hypothetical protein
MPETGGSTPETAAWQLRLSRLVADENLDLWLLAAAAAVFTVLGIVGVADQTLLASVILALLAVLALSQIRLRRHIAEIAEAGRVRATAVLQEEFPPDLAKRREQARDVLLIGIALSRTVQSYREPLRKALADGARVRIMVVDPLRHDLLRATQPPPPGLRGRHRIEHSLAELEEIRTTTPGNLEIRVASFIPGIGVNALDTATANGFLSIQHYEFESVDEPAPIMVFTPDEGRWYRRFLAEAERMWAAGTPWTSLPPDGT